VKKTVVIDHLSLRLYKKGSTTPSPAAAKPMASAPHITAAPVICAPLDDEPPLLFGEDELLGFDEAIAEATVEAMVASVATGLTLKLAWH
jgi:hypothetical protein